MSHLHRELSLNVVGSEGKELRTVHAGKIHYYLELIKKTALKLSFVFIILLLLSSYSVHCN